jgi:hypothetical protein
MRPRRRGALVWHVRTRLGVPARRLRARRPRRPAPRRSDCGALSGLAAHGCAVERESRSIEMVLEERAREGDAIRTTARRRPVRAVTATREARALGYARVALGGSCTPRPDRGGSLRGSARGPPRASSASSGRLAGGACSSSRSQPCWSRLGGASRSPSGSSSTRSSS